MKTINLFVGHGNGDPGASYYGKQEHAEALNFQNALKKYLDTNFKDHATKVIIEGNFATEKINYNLSGTGGLIKGACDFGFTLHFNAFTSASANGTEMYNAGERGNGFANYVLGEMSKLGFTNRGLKPEPFALYNLRNGGDYYWEACFISNKNDMVLWANNFNKIVTFVGNKIASELGLPKKQTTPIKNDFISRPRLLDHSVGTNSPEHANNYGIKIEVKTKTNSKNVELYFENVVDKKYYSSRGSATVKKTYSNNVLDVVFKVGTLPKGRYIVGVDVDNGIKNHITYTLTDDYKMIEGNKKIDVSLENGRVYVVVL